MSKSLLLSMFLLYLGYIVRHARFQISIQIMLLYNQKSCLPRGWHDCLIMSNAVIMQLVMHYAIRNALCEITSDRAAHLCVD